MRDVQIVKLSAHVRPAGRFLNAPGFVHRIESRVAIRLQRAREIAEMRLRMLALAIRRVGEPHRRRCCVSRRTVVAHIRPQPSGFCFAISRRQHRNRRVVGVQLGRAQHVTPQRFHQRREQPARAAHPVRQRRAFQLHAFARVNLRLAIQRQVIAIFRDQHVRQQSRSRNAALDRTARRFGLHDAFAARAGQLRSHLTDHFESRRHVLQNFRNIFAQRLQLAAAVRTSFLLRQILPHFARQVLGQRPPCCFRRDVCNGRDHCRCVRASCVLRLRRLQLVQPQLQLLDLTIQLLRLAPELHPPQLGDQQLQMLDLVVARSKLLVFRQELFVLARGSVLSVRWDQVRRDRGECDARQPLPRI